jgi:hypothetical protein
VRYVWGTLTGQSGSDRMTIAWGPCARKHHVPKRIDPSPFHQVRRCSLLVKS